MNICTDQYKNCTINSTIHTAYLELLATRRIPPTDFPKSDLTMLSRSVALFRLANPNGITLCSGAVKQPHDLAKYIRAGSRYLVLQDVSSLPFNNSEAAVECGGGA